MTLLKTEAVAAYMAGIIDGEGCVYVNRRKVLGRRKTPGYSVKVAVAITSPEIVEWFKEHAGLTSIHWSQPEGNRKPKWLCTWNNSVGAQLLREIRPYLVIKARQADLALELMGHLSTTKGHRGVQVSDEAVAYRETIKQRIAKLNERGKPKVDTGPDEA